MWRIDNRILEIWHWLLSVFRSSLSGLWDLLVLIWFVILVLTKLHLVSPFFPICQYLKTFRQVIHDCFQSSAFQTDPSSIHYSHCKQAPLKIPDIKPQRGVILKLNQLITPVCLPVTEKCLIEHRHLVEEQWPPNLFSTGCAWWGVQNPGTTTHPISDIHHGCCMTVLTPLWSSCFRIIIS